MKHCHTNTSQETFQTFDHYKAIILCQMRLQKPINMDQMMEVSNR